MELKILNKKEIKRILEKIKEQFGVYNFEFDYGMLMNKEGKIFLVSKAINKVDLSKLRINNIGLYIARLEKEIRLSIEGSQLFGKYASKNVYEVTQEETLLWLQGNDLQCSKEFNGFVIIKYKDDYLGSGKYKEGKILNYVPKERWIKLH